LGRNGCYTAVMRRALAALQALTMISNSIKWSLTAADPDWIKKTSASLTDTPISTDVSALEKRLRVAGDAGSPSRSRMRAVSSG
jgi:hypothetical protein